MWKRPIIIGIVCIVVVIGYCRWYCPHTTPVATCDCPATVEVFINERCNPVDGDGGPMNPLDVDPNDLVVWTNVNSDTAWVSFDGATPFELESFWMAPNGQWVSKVRSNAGGTPPVEYSYKLTCGGGGPISGPKVVVGGGGG